jgi:toxin secretion/phage lysis holin
MNIDKIKVGISTAMGCIGCIIGPWLGGWDKMLIGLLALMAADYIMGLTVAIVFKTSPKTKEGGVDSRASIKGLFKKISMLVGVFLAVQLDVVMDVEVTRAFVITFFIANEGISITENIALTGVPLPGFLIKTLEVMRDKGAAGNDSPIEK